MKKFTSIALACLLALAVVPAMAADQTNSALESTTSQAVDQAPATFQAFSKLAATEREALTPLTDTELAVIEGSFDVCLACLNIAIVTQTNIAIPVGVGVGVLGTGTGVGAVGVQSNVGGVSQSIN